MKEIENKFKNIVQIIQQKEEKINFENYNQKQVLTGHTSFVYGIDICKQRNLLASGSEDKTLKIWNLENNSLLKTYYNYGEFDVVFSNQGNLLAFGGGGDFSIKLIDISDLEKNNSIFELKGHNSYIRRLKFSNNSKYLISGSNDRTLRIWDITWKSEKCQLNQKISVFGFAISCDDNLIASTSYGDGKIRIWNFQSLKLLCTQKAHLQGAGIQFSNYQKILVSSGLDNGTIKLWSVEQSNQRKLLLIRKFKIATRCIWIVLFSDCNKFIISLCNLNKEIKVIDTLTGEIVKIFQSKEIEKKVLNNFQYAQVAVSQDMDIITYGENNDIVVWRQKQKYYQI